MVYRNIWIRVVILYKLYPFFALFEIGPVVSKGLAVEDQFELLKFYVWLLMGLQ